MDRMNEQIHHRASEGETNEASPLSLLVHAADAQTQGSPGASSLARLTNGAIERGRVAPASGSSLEEQLRQHQAAARAEAIHQSISQLRGGGTGAGGSLEAELFHQNAALMSAQQHYAAALALANDIRGAVAAAQLNQAPQFQNHQDLLFSRATALQNQIGALGGAGPAGSAPAVELSQLQQELELQGLEELERRQLLGSAADAPGHLAAMSSRHQSEQLREAHLRQEQLINFQQGLRDPEHSRALLERAGFRQSDTTDAPSIVPSSAEPAPHTQVSNDSAQNDQSSEKESFQKTPGSVVVPCRARGMPMDHNFKTAYFIIPEYVDHGEELICSYFGCRNAGIKFRYCTHCKVPVAKRNFRKRHKHGINLSLTKAGDSDNSDDEDVSSEKVDSGSVHEKNGAADALKQAAPPPPPVAIEAPSVQQEEETANHQKPPAAADSTRSLLCVEIAAANMNKESRNIAPERERLWASLLAKRPPTKDGDAVSAWLMEILSVSDLDTPLQSDESNPSDDAAPTQKAENSPSLSVLTKKKRPLALLQKEDAEAQTPTLMGSFSDWKDRKKHKALPKREKTGR